jgi:hypothetical protein
MVPTELLVTAMIGGFAIALTAVIAMAKVLGDRIADVRADLQGFRSEVALRFDSVEQRFTGVDGRFTGIEDRFTGMERRFTGVEDRLQLVQDELVTVRAALGGIDARLTTLEQR